MEWARRECKHGSKVYKSVHEFEKSLSDLLFSARAEEITGLVLAGAQVNNKSSSTKMLPLMWAIKHRKRAKITELLNNGAQVTEAMLASAANDIEVYGMIHKVYMQQKGT